MSLPTPYYERDGITLYCGDNRDILPQLEPESISAVCTDPPYGLSKEPDMAEVLMHWLAGDDYLHRGGGFMGKSWDSFVPGPATWRMIEATMKPGAHLLSFAGTRTSDLMGIAIRLAGLERRDTLVWLYGSGFPKSASVSKMVDKAAGVEREVTGWNADARISKGSDARNAVQGKRERVYNDETGCPITAPATDAAKQWDGWHTALKPAYESILMARKPLVGTVAANVLAHGTGAINVDGTRIPGIVPQTVHGVSSRQGEVYGKYRDEPQPSTVHEGGRWPANVLLDEDAAVMLDEQSGERKSGSLSSHQVNRTHANTYGTPTQKDTTGRAWGGDTGGASRYFPVLPIDDPDTARFLYCPKSSRAERNRGLEGMPEHTTREWRTGNVHSMHGGRVPDKQTQNFHPTVKPIALMSWLLTLVTPPGSTILDPFCGSGSTLVAAARLGIMAIGIEMDESYCEIAARRIDYALDQRAPGIDVT